MKKRPALSVMEKDGIGVKTAIMIAMGFVILVMARANFNSNHSK